MHLGLADQTPLQRPVVYMIYTHGHADHISGAQILEKRRDRRLVIDLQTAEARNLAG
jgi:glyoxylase-like metal-dependent hydrolase (beta-lactamase superfamily II)